MLNVITLGLALGFLTLFTFTLLRTVMEVAVHEPVVLPEPEPPAYMLREVLDITRGDLS